MVVCLGILVLCYAARSALDVTFVGPVTIEKRRTICVEGAVDTRVTEGAVL